jgi:branched-chain amino acid transport system substrate-binding protein
MTIRAGLATLWAAAALLASFGIADGTAQTIKVGVVLPYTGPLAAIGSQIERGVGLYVREHERDLQGITLQIIRRDDQGRPDAAHAAAQQLVAADRVDFVIGGATGQTAAAIAQGTFDSKVPFIALYAASNELTRKSPNMIRMSIAASQTSYAIGAWSARQGAKTGSVLVTDSPYGRDAEAAFTRGFSEGGGQIIGVEHIGGFGFDSIDFVGPLLKIKSARPNLVFAFLLSGSPPRALLKRFDELGLARDGIRLVGPQDLADDSVLQDMGEEIRGLTTAGSYSSAAERPQNREFVAAWNRAFPDKTMPDFMAVAAWDGMAAIFDVIRRMQGKFTSEQALEILRNWKGPDSPRGPVAIDPVTREAVQDIYIRRVELRGGRPVNVELETVPYRKGLSNLN